MCTRLQPRSSKSVEAKTQILSHWSLIDANQTALVTPFLEIDVGCKCRRNISDKKDSVELYSRPLITRDHNTSSFCTPNPCLNRGRCIATTTGFK